MNTAESADVALIKFGTGDAARCGWLICTQVGLPVISWGSLALTGIDTAPLL